LEFAKGFWFFIVVGDFVGFIEIFYWTGICQRMLCMCGVIGVIPSP